MKSNESKEFMPSFRDDISYNERISAKKEQEENIWEHIQKKVPWVIEIASDEKDMSGIDAITNKFTDGRSCIEKTIQLKTRQSGNDILIETVNPFCIVGDRFQFDGFTGRDMKTLVNMYFCVDSTGILRIYNGKKIKSIAESMTNEFIKKIMSGNKFLKTEQGEVRIVKDPSFESNYKLRDVSKIIVFIDPKLVKPTYTVDLS